MFVFLHCPYCLRSTVYAFIGCLSVRPSVCPSVCLSVPVWATAANIAVVARPGGDIDRLLHGAQQRGVRMRVVPRNQRT